MKTITNIQEIVCNHFKQFEKKYLLKKGYKDEILFVEKVGLTLTGISYMRFTTCMDNKKHQYALTNLGFTGSSFFEMSEEEAIKQMTINKLKEK